jgi:two-component system chemotaxis sensor kinase CheA
MEPDAKLLKLLIETFTIELEEQTQIMTEAILALEKIPPDDSAFMKQIDTIFRAAHNIKGASRSIGITNVGNLAHQLENLFSSLQKKLLPISALHVDLALEAVDKMRLAMQAYLENKPLGYNIEDILSRLENNSPQTPLGAPSQEINTTDSSTPSSEISLGDNVKNADSIRVSIENIDRVSTLMEEILVTKTFMSEHETNLLDIAVKCKEIKDTWNKNILINKSSRLTEDKDITLFTDQITEVSHFANELKKGFHTQINDLFLLSNSLQAEVSRLRLVPASLLLRTLPRVVRDLSRELDKNVELHIKGDDVKMDKLILEKLNDPFIHLIRNAIDHGFKTSQARVDKNKSPQEHINIEIIDEGNEILIVFRDDGEGMDLEKIGATAVKKNIVSEADLAAMSASEISQLIFRPGFSTSEIITTVSGRGIGLDIVKSNLTELKGSVIVESTPGVGTTFYLRVPLTLASEHGLIVISRNQHFVIPTHAIVKVLSLQTADIIHVVGQEVLLIDNQPTLLRALPDLLDMPAIQSAPKNNLFAVVVKRDWQTLAIAVDEILGEREIVVKSLQHPLTNITGVAGATLSSRGEVVLVLNPADLILKSMSSRFATLLVEEDDIRIIEAPHILVVDDSITTRTLEQSVLENKGYKVTIAVNGKEAWDILQNQKFSLLITDVNMPIMDGFELTAKVKNSATLRDLPVIIVTSLDTDHEKRRGIEVGANAYIVKSEFESNILLQTVSQLV